MDTNKLVSAVDHTLLTVTATWEEVRLILDDAVKHGAASACIPPSYVERAKEYVGDSLPLCTVVGFPNGYATTAAKVFEAEDAIRAGADEIDMVVNLGWVRDGLFDRVLTEIRALRKACEGHILKVIVETCLLTEEEKVILCKVVTDAGADYIKTSTGFSTGGATKPDVMLLVGNVGPGVAVKASGGISTLQEAEDYLELGACRLGTSRVIGLLKQEQNGAGY